jgi:hypothetical protein
MSIICKTALRSAFAPKIARSLFAPSKSSPDALKGLLKQKFPEASDRFLSEISKIQSLGMQWQNRSEQHGFLAFADFKAAKIKSFDEWLKEYNNAFPGTAENALKQYEVECLSRYIIHLGATATPL